MHVPAFIRPCGMHNVVLVALNLRLIDSTSVLNMVTSDVEDLNITMKVSFFINLFSIS